MKAETTRVHDTVMETEIVDLVSVSFQSLLVATLNHSEVFLVKALSSTRFQSIHDILGQAQTKQEACLVTE